MTQALDLVLVLLIVGYVGLITPTLFRLCRAYRPDELTPEWMETFSPRSYYPMEHLLGEEDFAFLCRQPGFDLVLYRKFRRDRLRIFRQYLHRMISDFNRLHLAARVLISQSEQDNSALLRKLVALKIRFSVSVLRAEVRYGLCYLGLSTLSVRQLVSQLEEMSEFVGMTSPVHAN